MSKDSKTAVAERPKTAAAEAAAERIKDETRAVTKLASANVGRQRATMLAKHGWAGETAPHLRKALAALTFAYGLDPAMKDIQILAGNQFYISKSAYDKKAQDDPNWQGWTFSRPANKEERTKFLECLPTDISEAFEKSVMWVSEFKIKGRDGTFSGVGFASYADTPIAAKAYDDAKKNFNEIGGNAKGGRILLRQAQKRAEHAALLQAYSYRLPDPKKLAELGIDGEVLKDVDYRVLQGDEEVETIVAEQELDETLQALPSEATPEDGGEPKSEEQPTDEPAVSETWARLQNQIDGLMNRDPDLMRAAMKSQGINSPADRERAGEAQLRAAVKEFNRLVAAGNNTP